MNITKKTLKNSFFLLSASIFCITSLQAMDINQNDKKRKIEAKSTEAEPNKKSKKELNTVQKKSVFQLIKKGDSETIKKIIAAHYDLNFVATLTDVVPPHEITYSDCSPFSYALSIKQGKIATLLFKYGASINVSRDFAVVCNNHDREMAQFILDNVPHDPLLNQVLGKALIKACRNNLTMVELLIKNGADVNFQDIAGQTALMAACSHGKIETAQFLLKNGADPDLKTYLGMNALDLAETPEIMQLLLEYGAKIQLDATNILESEVKAYLFDRAAERLNKIKLLLAYNTQFKNLDDEYNADISKHPQLEPLFNEILTYQKNNNNNALMCAMTNNDQKNSAFTRDEWLTLAVLKNHTRQIQYCIDKKLLKPFEILEGLTVRPSMPLTLLPQLYVQMNKDEKSKFKNFIEKTNNTKMLDALQQYYLGSSDDKEAFDLKFIYKYYE